MSYLIPNDYLPLIQSGNLNAIQVNNPAIRAQAERTAIGEAVSMLKQKYDTASEFTNTTAWVAGGPGAIPGRAPLTAAAWSISATYAMNDLVLYTDNNVYQSAADNNTATPGVSDWFLLGPLGSTLYYAADRVYLDAQSWRTAGVSYDSGQTYNPGDVTNYSATVYECLLINTNSTPSPANSNWKLLYAYTPYQTGDLTLFTDGNVYQANTGSSDVTFNPSGWTLLGPQYTFFYVTYPVPVFDFTNGIYKMGDQIFWNNRIYTCIKPTLITDHQAMLQVHELENQPYGNVFPTDPVNGLQWWGEGVPYMVPTGTLVTDITYWTQGDNRDPQMVQKLIDMTLFHLLSSIAPRNIPELRRHRYMGEEGDQVKQDGEVIYPMYSALGWLQSCTRGSVMPALPLLQPLRGNRIRYGGTVRNVNSY